MKEVWAYICLNTDRKETTETEVDIGMDECRAQGEVLFLDRDTRNLVSDGEGPCSSGISFQSCVLSREIYF